MDKILNRTRSRTLDKVSVRFSRREAVSSVFKEDDVEERPGAQTEDDDDDHDEADLIFMDQNSEDQKSLISTAEIDEDGVVREYEVALKHLGFGLFHIILLIVNGTTLLSDIIEILSISYIFPVLIRNNEWDVGSKEQAILGSIIFVGMLFGSYIWGGLADVMGRKPTMIVSLTISVVFGIVSAFSPWFWLFVVFRLFSGFGVGGSIPVVFSYSSEFVRNKYRGTYLSMQSVFWMIGRVLCSGMAWLILSMGDFHMAGHEVHNWRVFLAVSALPALVGAMMYCIFPESPRYLLEMGKQKKALRVLGIIYKINHLCSKTDYPVKKILLDGARSVSSDSRNKMLQSVRVYCLEIFFRNVDLFQRKYLRQTLLLLVIFFCLSFGSYGVTLWYPTYVNDLNAEKDAEELMERCNSSTSLSGPVKLSTFCDCSSTTFEGMSISNQELKNWKTSIILFINVTFINVTFDTVLFNATEFRDCEIVNSKFIAVYFNSSTFIHVVFKSIDVLPGSMCISENSDGEIILDHVNVNGKIKTKTITLSNSSERTDIDLGIGTGCKPKQYFNIYCATNDFRVYRDSLYVSVSHLAGNIASAIAVYYLRRNHWLAITMLASTVCVFLLYAATSEVAVVVLLCLFTAASIPAWHDSGLIIVELYPTHLRSTAYGAHLLMARIGAIIGTNIFGLFVLANPNIPIFLVASLLFVGAVASIGLPVTTRKTLLK